MHDCVSQLEDCTHFIPVQISAIKNQVAFLQKKCDDYNLRIIGLQKRVEGINPGTFVTFVKFPEAAFPTAFTVERTNRVPAKPSPSAASK